MLLQQGGRQGRVSAALDSSWAALTFSPPLSHRRVPVLRNWKSPEVTSQVY